MGRYFTNTVNADEAQIVKHIRARATRLTHIGELDRLMQRIGDARIVMLGEASHGTHEFYSWRSHISERLIREKGFNFIAVEGDWPDCYRLNRFIKHYGPGQEHSFHVLKSFRRWPTWMWANWEIVALAQWLHDHNRKLPVMRRVGFYGLDVYSLWESMEAVMQYLQKADPEALPAAEEAIRCFEPYRSAEGQGYARASQLAPAPCRDEVVQLLTAFRRNMAQYNTDHEHVFSTEQNALTAVNAEKYYRAMVEGGPHCWNIRDRHMADTLDRLLEFHGPRSKAIVWAHNTHIGDARATDMVDEGMYNIGELVRLKHHDNGVVLVGLGTYGGSVVAGRSWGAAMQKMEVPPAIRNSWEYLLHQADGEARSGNKLLIMDDFMDDVFLENHIAHRAIGVVYNPEYERYGNYVPSILPMRYDAFIHLEETMALHPLHIEPDGQQVPETFPFGL